MAFANKCDTNPTSPFCNCTDYFGNNLPEFRNFHSPTQTYHCCNKLTNVNTTYNALTDSVLDYAKASESDGKCLNFLNSIDNDTKFKEKFPLLYHQSLLNASLYSRFTTPSVINNNNIQCSSGKPYILIHPNYADGTMTYKYLCAETIDGVSDLKFLVPNTEQETDTLLPYRLRYIRNEDGTDCKESECKLKYNTDTQAEYNIGSEVYRSKGSIESKSLLLKWWFWFILLMVVIICCILVYLYYHHVMQKNFEESANYLNNVKKGLGNTAKQHSMNEYNSHFHMGA